MKVFGIGFNLCLFLSLFWAHGCFAELFEYTDSDGVVHFTDDPQKVPAKMRKSSKKVTESSLTTKESNMLEHLMQLDKAKGIPVKDVPVTDLRKVKQNLNDLAERYKDKYDDPEQTLDPRLSTPEDALNLFKAALKAGNFEDIKASVTSHFWQRGLFRSDIRIRKELDKVLSNHSIIKGEQNEKYATFQLKKRTGDQEPIVGSIEMMNLFGNWKIYEIN